MNKKQLQAMADDRLAEIYYKPDLKPQKGKPKFAVFINNNICLTIQRVR